MVIFAPLIIVFLLMKNIRLKFFVPAIIWAALIFVASSIPDISTPSFGFKMVDKIIHFIIFFILGVLISYGFGKGRINSVNIFWISIGITILYGIFDEFHQFFVPGRHMDAFDVLADALGAATASGLYSLKLKRRVQ